MAPTSSRVATHGLSSMVGPFHSTTIHTPRKITPVTKKASWKKRLYRECLDETRRARAVHGPGLDRNLLATDILKRHAIEITPYHDKRRRYTDSLDQNTERPRRTVQFDNECMDVVDEPLRRIDEDNDEGSRQPQNQHIHHYITEEELFDLLTEAEEEIEREEMQRQEQLLDDFHNHEQQYLQEQVTDFEEWEGQQNRMYQE